MKNPEFWKWVGDHADDNPHALWLKYGKTHASEIVQVECRRRFGKKLGATLLQFPHWLFPSVLAGEQSTSDLLAAFHARLVPECGRIADLTAGLGIDVLHCSGIASDVVAVEIDSEKADALKMNIKSAGIDNVDVVCDDCRRWLETYGGPKLDMAFIDPARRSADGGRVFGIADCEPDVCGMLPLLRRKVSRLLVKLSPMLDVSAVLDALPCCVRVFALGTPTECKEILALVDFEHPAADSAEISVEAVTVGADFTSEFHCTRAEEMVADAVYGRPRTGDYMCEPYPSIMKIGAVRLLSRRFCLQKLAPNTHAYFAPGHVAGFPGEQRRVVDVLPYASSVIKRFSRMYPRIEVATRNFGVGADILRRKLGVTEGADYRLLAVTDIAGEKLLIVLEGKKH